MAVVKCLIGVVEFLANNPFVVVLLVFGGFSVGVPIVLTYLNVMTMRKGVKLVPAPQEGNAHRFKILAPFHDWAVRNEFDYVSAYTMQLGVTAFLGAWRHRQHSTYLVVILAGGSKIPSFTTEFSGERSLDTSGSNQDMFPGTPGHYKQSFKDLSLDELFARHLEAAQYLTRVGQIPYVPTMFSLEESVDRDAKRLAAYIRSIPAWPFRAVYWYYVSRRQKAGKTIEQQHKAGHLLLPNDPGFRDFQYVGR